MQHRRNGRIIMHCELEIKEEEEVVAYFNLISRNLPEVS
jgi:hypothetical protein